MGIWERRVWNVECVRCRIRGHQEGGHRKGFIRNLRTEGWFIYERKTLCPKCREKQRLPVQEVTAQ
jgi:hypothetical protein